jgi:hypothetical protein
LRASAMSDLFAPNFFGWTKDTPFGREWTLVPEDYHLNDTYLGYSIESDCMQKELPAYESKRRQVWVLAKHARYFKGELLGIQAQRLSFASDLSLTRSPLTAWICRCVRHNVCQGC